MVSTELMIHEADNLKCSIKKEHLNIEFDFDNKIKNLQNLGYHSNRLEKNLLDILKKYISSLPV